MPSYLKIPVYLVVALVVGALVAPPVFWLGQFLSGAGISGWLADFPFHRVLSRCLQVSFLVLLWPALRWIGLRRPSDLGLRRNPVGVRDLFAGLASGLVTVGLLAGGYVASGLFTLRPEPDGTAVVRILGTAAVVSVIEEVVFRGIILGVCLWSLRPRGAILVSTILFAAVHFLKPSKSLLLPGEIRWFSGLAEVSGFAAGWPSEWVLFSGVASLLLAGWILGRAAVDTASLWLPIGLHAGWIFGVQATNLFLKPAAVSQLPWVGPGLVSGAVPTGLLPLVGLVFAGWLLRLYQRHVFRPTFPRVG